MHRTCIACHERKRESVDRPALADCSTCHEELRGRAADDATMRFVSVSDRAPR
jgi:hypothetical protein